MNKRKLMLVAVSLCMVAILGFGGTLAYLTDTDNQINTFTTGKVEIKLDEEIVAKQETAPSADNYGDFIPTGEGRTEENQEYKKLFPGNNVLKDPTITVDAASEDAWVAAKIVITGKGLDSLIGSAVAPGYIDITKVVGGNETGFVTGGLAGDTNADYMENGYHGLTEFFDTGKAYTRQVPDAANGVWTIYIYVQDVKAAGDEVVLFENIHIAPQWNNDQIAILDGMTVNVTAYGVQADGFEDCFTAMATAFPDAFPAGDVNVQ